MRDYTVTAVGRTHVGLVKPNNEDSFHIGPGLLIVADGVGGSAAGEVASQTVVDIFADVQQAAPGDDLYALLTTAVQRSTTSLAEQVRADPSLEGMGTTATVMMWSGRRIVFAQIGDSRAYFLQFGAPGAPRPADLTMQLHQVTKDDSFVQHLIDRGTLDPSDAAQHPRRNVILKALNGSTVAPTFSTFAPRRGDRYLLCSDGLSDYVSRDQILQALTDTPADVASDTLIEAALAAGGPDNITVVVADIVAG